MRLLVIEDDPMIGRAVVAGLQGGGYAVDWVRDGAEAELALANRVYDLALLDLGLPRRDGLEILKGLRRRGNRLPVVVITARDAVADRIAGLDHGADDYLVKPFDLDELLARARAVIRRREGRALPQMTCGVLTVDPVKRLVTFLGATYALTRHQIGAMFDEELRQVAHAVHLREDWTQTRRVRIARPGFALSVRAYDNTGRVYFETALPSLPGDVPQTFAEGFAFIDTSEGPWRVYTHVTEEGNVQVGQAVAARDALARALSI